MATKKSKSRQPARTKRAAKALPHYPPPQPYRVTANSDTVTRFCAVLLGDGAVELGGPDTVEFSLAGQIRRRLDAAIERATPKPPPSEPDVAQALSYLEDTRRHFVAALIGLHNSDHEIGTGLEALAEIANLVDVAMLELGGRGTGLAPEAEVES